MSKELQRGRIYAGDFDVYSAFGIGTLEADLDSHLFGSFHSAGTLNHPKIRDSELDKLLEAQRREVDSEKRGQLHRQAARRIIDQAWGTTLTYPAKQVIWHPYVKGIYPRFGDYVSGALAWVER